MRRVILGLLSASGLAGPAFAAPPAWTISESSSGVMINHAGLTKVALRGGKVEAGDVITTGTNARAVLVRGEEYAVVAPNSRLQVTDPAESGGLTQFLERVGNVVFSIKKMTTPHFGVQTPYLAAVVKGTTFSVTVDDNGASVQVVEGAVEVATKDGGARELLRPGAIASVGAGDLGKMTIQGSVTKTLRSPGPAMPPAAVPTVAKSAVASNEANIAVQPAMATETKAIVETSAPVTPVNTASVIQASIDEAPASISKLSGGLIAGDTAARVAVATSATSGADHAVAVATNMAAKMGGAAATGPATGASDATAALPPVTSGSNAGSGLSGNGNASGGGAAADTGNSGGGNAGSNGSSGKSGDNGNTNAGSGNSGSDNSGKGNGNSGSNSSGNNGNGSGNSGSNSSGNSGNGNGNSGSNSSGNSGNGNSNSGSNSSGNSGNGNSNSGSNSSGNSGNGNSNSGSNSSGNSGNGNGNSGSNSGSQNNNNQGDDHSGNSGKGNSGSGKGQGSGNGGGLSIGIGISLGGGGKGKN